MNYWSSKIVPIVSFTVGCSAKTLQIVPEGTRVLLAKTPLS